jgi:hypothetical protein
MTVVIAQTIFEVNGLDEEELSQFKIEMEQQFQAMTADFQVWSEQLKVLKVTLDKDPTLNLGAFYEKLEWSQDARNQAVEIIGQALAYRAAWENNLYQAEKYLRMIRSDLGKYINKKENKNKESQEAALYSFRPDVFECFHRCEATLAWIKTMLDSFNKKLDNLESANLNVNRQITVTELLTYKGLL